MKATSKLRPPHPNAERPLQGVRGSFYQLIARMPTLHHQMFHISPVSRCFKKCAKMRTFESERVIGGMVLSQVWHWIGRMDVYHQYIASCLDSVTCFSCFCYFQCIFRSIFYIYCLALFSVLVFIYFCCLSLLFLFCVQVDVPTNCGCWGWWTAMMHLPCTSACARWPYSMWGSLKTNGRGNALSIRHYIYTTRLN